MSDATNELYGNSSFVTVVHKRWRVWILWPSKYLDDMNHTVNHLCFPTDTNTLLVSCSNSSRPRRSPTPVFLHSIKRASEHCRMPTTLSLGCVKALWLNGMWNREVVCHITPKDVYMAGLAFISFVWYSCSIRQIKLKIIESWEWYRVIGLHGITYLFSLLKTFWWKGRKRCHFGLGRILWANEIIVIARYRACMARTEGISVERCTKWRKNENLQVLIPL